MGDGDLTPVAVDAVFERFPASVRGAVVVRGVDADPHQIRLRSADVVEVSSPGRPVRPLALGDVVVDVAPRDRVMIPFEVAFADLDPGWYGVRAVVAVDGQQEVNGPDRLDHRFCVPWPAGSVRRESIDAGVRIKVPGSGGATVERLACRAEKAVVHWRHAPSEDPSFREFDDLKVTAGRRRLPVLGDVFEWSTGARTTTIYPVLKDDTVLTFELDRRNRPDKPVQRGPWSAPLRLD